MESTCTRCGQTITLIQTGKNTFHWVTDSTQKETWHCGNDPRHPVLAHQPVMVGVSTG